MNEQLDIILETLLQVGIYQGTTILLKIGGSILESEDLITHLCTQIKLLKQLGMKIVIVHGGSKAINKALAIYNIKSEFINGLRVTSKPAMHIIEMILCGKINKMLTRKLNSLGISAIGLSGSDGNMLLCKPYSSQHGQVGKIQSINLQPM